MKSYFVYEIEERAKLREELDVQIKAFLEAGGKVTQLPPCAMSDEEEQRKNHKFVI